MVERPPFSGRRRPRNYNLEENPELLNQITPEQQEFVVPTGRRRQRFNNQGNSEGTAVNPDVQESSDVPPMNGRKRRQFNPEEVGELPGTLGIPEDTLPRRRRANPASLSAPGPSGVTPAVPPVPPVPEKQKAIHGESLLESIIKLVNSILTFKGK